MQATAADEAAKWEQDHGYVPFSDVKAVGRQSRVVEDYADYDKPITHEDIALLRRLFPTRKNINDFTSEEIKATQKWAYKYFKQMGVKSPFFRAWFGDWRAQDKNSITPVICKADVQAKAGSAYNADIQERLSWDKNSIRESIINANKNYRPIMEIISPNISEIVKSSILLETVTSNKDSKRKMQNTAFMHGLYAIAEVNGYRYVVKLFAEEAFSERDNVDFMRAYTIKGIEIATGFDQRVFLTKEGLPYSPPAAHIKNIADLYAFVKANDKEFHPGRSVAPELLNSDGTPKVLWHGTGERFDAFDITKSRSWSGSPDFDLPGFYFIEDRRQAEDYGEAKPYYLRADKVFRTDNIYDLKKKYGSFRRAFDALTGMGYDLVIQGEGDSTEYIALKAANVKSADENIGTFDRSDDRYRFSYAGTGSATGDKTLLQQAKDMAKAGRGSEVIRQETGWFKGYDGKWRYEIDDSRMEVDLTGKLMSNPDARSYNDLTMKFLNGDITPKEEKELRRLQDVLKGVNTRPHRLVDIMRHDALFEAYPGLRWLNVRVSDNLGANGSFSPSTQTIEIDNAVARDPNRLKKVLAHEIQHAIQFYEGHSEGASPFFWATAKSPESVDRDAREKMGRILANVPRELQNKLYRMFDLEDAMTAAFDSGNVERGEKYSSESDALYTELYGYDWFGPALRAHNALDEKSTVYRDLYFRTAGEIEAADTADRLELTDEQRREKRPNIDRTDVVFAEKPGEAKWSRQAEDARAEAERIDEELRKQGVRIEGEGQPKFSRTSEPFELKADNELAQRVKNLHGSAKYNAIRDYILETLAGEDVVFSDGRHAIVDRSDASHLVHKASPLKIAEVSELKALIKSATLIKDDTEVQHDKFSHFIYYEVAVKFNGDRFNLVLNVGKGKNDGKYHLYEMSHPSFRNTGNGLTALGDSTSTDGGTPPTSDSMNTVPHPDDSVKGRSSRITTDSAFAYSATAKENEALRRTVASLSRTLEKTRLQLNAAKEQGKHF